MRKMVKLVGPILSKLVPLYGPDVPYYSMLKPSLTSLPGGPTAMMLVDNAPLVEYAPVIHLCGAGRDDVFVAYTKDVEELLGIPIRTILSENDCLSQSLEAIKSKCFSYEGKFHRITQMMTFWQRLKFLFTNDLTEVLM